MVPSPPRGDVRCTMKSAGEPTLMLLLAPVTRPTISGNAADIPERRPIISQIPGLVLLVSLLNLNVFAYRYYFPDSALQGRRHGRYADLYVRP